MKSKLLCQGVWLDSDDMRRNPLLYGLDRFKGQAKAEGGAEVQDWKSEVLFGLSSATTTYCDLLLHVVCLLSFGSPRVYHRKLELLTALQSCLAKMTHDSFVCSSASC